MQNLSMFWKSDFSKNMFLAWFYNGFRRLRVAKVDRKSINNQSKIDGRKMMQNRANIIKHDAKMVPKSIRNRSQIVPKIDAKIDAKFVVQRSVKNRALERQRVAKVTSQLQRCEVSGPEGSPYSCLLYTSPSPRD